MASFYQSAATGSQTTRPRWGGLGASAAAIAVFIVQPSLAQSLPLSAAAQLASEHAPMVNTSTLLAFAYHESRLRPFAIHDNTIDLYRPRFLGHQIEPYATSASG
jgi:hypothetical protein